MVKNRSDMIICCLSLLLGGCLLSFFIPTSCFGLITFERVYGGAETDRAYSVQQTSDGGYIIVGETSSFPGPPDYNIWLVKTDSLGDTIWTRSFGGYHQELGYSVQQTEDGGYILTGLTRSFGPQDSDVYLIRTDFLGDTLWSRVYGGTGDDKGYSVQQTSDGGYIIVGETSSFGAGNADVWLLKTDPVGHIIWTRIFGGSLRDRGSCVRQTSDGGYVLTGQTFGIMDLAGLFLAKTDSLGDSLWTRIHGGYADYGHSVEQTLDGGYIIAGSSPHLNLGESDIWLLKTDASGDTTWTKAHGGKNPDLGYSAQQTLDGGYVITGKTYSSSVPMFDVFLLKTDSLGDTIWARMFGGDYHDVGYCVQQTADGGYVVAGYTRSFGGGANSPDFYLIKTDEDGLVGIQEEDQKLKNEKRKLLDNRPNPFRGTTLISYSLPASGYATLEVFDITGRLVETLVNEKQEPRTYRVNFHAKDRPDGIYFYKLHAGDFSQTRKMVLLR